jgi:hypothetical protein
MATIDAQRSALDGAQRSAQAVASACGAAGGAVSSMGGLAMPGCDIVAAAWSRFTTAAGAYVSAFGEAADILGQKVGAAAATYQATESGVAASMAGTTT